jgi:hypothetical protein
VILATIPFSRLMRQLLKSSRGRDTAIRQYHSLFLPQPRQIPKSGQIFSYYSRNLGPFKTIDSVAYQRARERSSASAVDASTHGHYPARVGVKSHDGSLAQRLLASLFTPPPQLKAIILVLTHELTPSFFYVW